MSILPYAQAVGITALLFPLARPLYMNAAPGMRAQGPRSPGSRATGVRP
jgi:hypothetical protein